MRKVARFSLLVNKKHDYSFTTLFSVLLFPIEKHYFSSSEFVGQMKMNANTSMSNAAPDAKTSSNNAAPDAGGTNGEFGEASMVFSTDEKMNSGESDVRFRSKSSIEEIMRISRISNYDTEEVINYWGDSVEKAAQKADLKKAVNEMYYNRRGSDSEFTTLGLGDKAGHGRAVRKANKMISRSAVMDEQDLQIHEGIPNDELLADVYSITSTAAKREGRIRAERLHEALKEEGSS